MRVTANTFPTSLLNQLNSLSVRQNRLQTQAATGQRITLPEDDPVAMRRVIDMQGETKALGQYERNIARQQELATGSYNAIRALKQISDRAREIAITADDLKSPAELAILGREVSELIRQGVQLTNTENRGDFLFAGTRVDVPPFVSANNPDGTVASVTYQGNSDVAESEIAENLTFTAQAVGENSSSAGPRGLITDSRVGADFFNHLISLQDSLLAGDVTTIANTSIDELEADEENFIFHVGTNGALQSRLETTASLTRARTATLVGLISKEADVDLAETIVRLNQTQTAYQAALQSGGKILGTSLLDYLQ